MNLKGFMAWAVFALSVSAAPLSPAEAAPAAVTPSYAAPPSVFAAATVKDFLADCASDQGGCADEVGTALMDNMTFDGSANICLPGPDFSTGAVDWLKAHPETAGMKTEDGIYLALQKSYPCG
jgi:hypothetical protein